jgi:hypothetical protein
LLNIPETDTEVSAAVTRAAENLDLLDHLARIAAVWPAMLPTLTQAPVSQIVALISDFVRLVEPLPAAWTAWYRMAGQSEQAMRGDFSLREQHKDGLLALALARTGELGAASLPQIVIQLGDGVTTYTARPNSATGECFYTDENGNRLRYDAALGMTRRRVAFTGLDVASFQNASSGVQITRNADLVRDEKGQVVPTSGEFVYRTPPLYFTGNATPALSSGERFDVSLLSSPRRQALATHLQRMLGTLYDGTESETIQKLRLDAVYVQPICDGLPEAEWPIVVGSPIAIDRERAVDIASQLAAALVNWFVVNRPNGGHFRFKVTLFSRLSERLLPLLELTDTELALSDITDLP